MLDSRTFGSSKAAISLVEILNKNNNPKEVTKVSRKLIEFNKSLRDLTNSKSVIKPHLGNLLLKEVIEGVNGSFNISEEAKSFVVNVIKTAYRVWLTENENK